MIKKAARRTSSSQRTAAPRKRAASTASARRARPEPKRRDDAVGGDSEAQRPAPVLGARELRELRAQAHALSPLVQVGHGGVSPEVLTAVSRALRDHELIKVRLHEPEDKRGMADALAEGTRSALCGLVGHTVILYRPRPKQREQRARAPKAGSWS